MYKHSHSHSHVLVLIIAFLTIFHQEKQVLAFSMTMSQSHSQSQSLPSTSTSTQSKPVVKLSQAQEMTKPKVWNDYKKTLIEAGVLDVRESRPISIKAVNININNGNGNDNDNGNNGSSAENSMRGDNDGDNAGDKNKGTSTSTSTLITSKIVHFQRHGQGYHNLLGDVVRASGREVHIDIDDCNPERNPFVKPEIQDSPLTFQGRTEATSRRYEASMLSPQLIVVSPLVRAVQTALLTFADHIYAKKDKMKIRVPLIAVDGCREQLGLLTCNKALPLSQTKSEFPEVDFSLVTHDEDDHLWNQYESRRESPIDEANRAYDFLTNFLMEREEEEVAVVCHSAWLFSVCNAVIDCGGDDSLESWFGTGEIRSLKVSYYRNE